jgi:hypothetical protein
VAPTSTNGSNDDESSADASRPAPPPPPAQVCEAAQDAGTDADRGERIRLLSLDGFTDPRNDNSELDTEFIIIHDLAPFPTTFQASRNEHRNEIEALEAMVVQYQRMMRELDGAAEPDRAL